MSDEVTPRAGPPAHRSPRDRALQEALQARSPRPAALLDAIRQTYPALAGLASARRAALLDVVRAAGL